MTTPPDSRNTLQFLSPALEGRREFRRVVSPVGELLLVSDGRAICGLYMDGARHARPLPEGASADRGSLAVAEQQLAEYFAGERTAFALEVAPVGTAFQLAVWRALGEIPYGRTESYGGIAAAIGRPAASRAVGAANGHNPISLIVPCHRVIGANGSLTGYAGGLDRKTALLDLEQKVLASR